MSRFDFGGFMLPHDWASLLATMFVVGVLIHFMSLYQRDAKAKAECEAASGIYLHSEKLCVTGLTVIRP